MKLTARDLRAQSYIEIADGMVVLTRGQHTVKLNPDLKSFRKKLTKALYDLRCTQLSCSSSIDFPEENDAPESTTEDVALAYNAAHKRIQKLFLS